MALFMNWRGSGVDETLHESSFTGPTDAPPFADAVPILGTGSIAGPALATFDGSRFMAWRGVIEDEHLYFATNDGSGWRTQIQLPDRGSGNGPTLATFQGQLIMAWRGAAEDQQLYWATYPDETRDPPWSDQHQLADRGSFRGPALAVFAGQLFMAWRGVEGDQHLYWSTFDGQGWSDQHPLSDRVSVDCPMLVPFGTSFFMFWRGGSGLDVSDLQLYTSTYEGGDPSSAWSPQQPVINTAGHFIGTGSRPGASVFNGQVFIATVGNPTSAVIPTPGSGGDPGQPEPPDDPQIFVETFDGTSTVGHVPTPQGTDYQPALSGFQNDRYAGLWVSIDGPPWQARHRLTADEYQQTFEDLGSQGYRLVDVSGY